jgi:ribose transport system substrate-binding protein
MRNNSLIVPLTCLLLAACGGDDEDASEEQAPVTIGWLAKGSANDFFDLSRHAAQLAADDLTSASGREVTVELLDSEETTPEAQAERVRAAIDMPVDALAISSLDPAIVGPSIDEAVAAGIPVITFDSDAPESDRLTYYGINNLAGAELCARILGEQMGGQGQVAIMTAGSAPGVLSTSQTYVDRMAGFQDVLAAEYPDIEIVSTTVCSNTDADTRNGCADILEEVVAQYPDITGWYLSRGRVLREATLGDLAPNWAAGVLAGTTTVVGFDLPQDALPAVQAGLAQAVVNQDYFGWGYDVVSLAFDVVTQNRQVEDFTDSGLDVVCPNNVDQVASMWESQDFRQALTPCDLLPE